MCGVQPSITLKAAIVHACDNQNGTLFDVSDARLQLVNFCWMSTIVPRRLRDCLKHRCGPCTIWIHNNPEFLSLKHCCRVFSVGSGSVSIQTSGPCDSSHQPCMGPPSSVQYIDSTISLFHKALALCPLPHPNHLLCHILPVYRPTNTLTER